MTIKDIFNNNYRSIKIIIEFLLFLIAAFLGAIFSLTLVTGRSNLFVAVISFLIILSVLLIFRDWYESPKRIDKSFMIRNTNTNTTLILKEINELKNRKFSPKRILYGKDISKINEKNRKKK